MKIKMPKDVEYIIDKIYKKGYEAFIVGGCVRDSIIGLKPNDYDITTNASPSQIINIFKGERIIETGIKHGTVTLIKNKFEYEITTYRIDGEYNDNRRPECVEFTSDIMKDLQRRDFTINAIAYNYKVGIVDIFGGIKDIQAKLIKTVGEAHKRFEEDGLRIIRAVRFSCKLGFDIENNTNEGIYKNISLIKNVSLERIQEELNKILMSDNPEKLYTLYDAGMFNELGIYDIKIQKNELNYIKDSKKDLITRLTILIYIMGNNINSRNILNILKYPNSVKHQCITILDYLNQDIDIDKTCIKLCLHKIGKENFIHILNIKMILEKQFTNDKYEKILRLIKEIEEKNECYSLQTLAINGNDLKALGYNGKDVGLKLSCLLNRVIENSEINNKLKLMEILKDM